MHVDGCRAIGGVQLGGRAVGHGQRRRAPLAFGQFRDIGPHVDTQRSGGRRTGAEPVLPPIPQRAIAGTSEPALVAEQQLAMERGGVGGRDCLAHRRGRRRRCGNGPGTRGGQRGQENDHQRRRTLVTGTARPSRHSEGPRRIVRAIAALPARGYTDARHIPHCDRSLRWSCVAIRPAFSWLPHWRAQHCWRRNSRRRRRRLRPRRPVHPPRDAAAAVARRRSSLRKSAPTAG